MQVGAFLHKVAFDCWLGALPSTSPEDMRRCLIETNAKLDTVIALMSDEHRLRDVSALAIHENRNNHTTGAANG